MSRLTLNQSRYDGTCIQCAVRTPAEALLCFRDLDSRAFRTVCKGCAPAFTAHYEATHRPVVRIAVEAPLPSISSPHPIVIRAAHLTPEEFDEFLPIVRGCTYVPEGRLNVVPEAALREVIEALMACPALDPHLALDANIKAILRAQDEAYNASLREIEARVDKGLTLYPFQISGTAWLKSRKRALLADDMGLGKTIQVLSALPDKAPVLIICPNVAKGVWRREIRRWRKDYLIVDILQGRGTFKWPGKGRVVICNYDIMPDNLPEDCEPGTVVILDEGHVLKNATTLRHARAKNIAQTANVDRCYMLTATPLQNRPTELWAILEILKCEEEAYGTFGQFCYAFNGFPTSGWGEPRPQAATGFARVALRRTKREVLKDLPAKTREFIQVNIKLTRSEQFIIEEAEEALWEYGAGVPFELIAKARAITAKAKGPAALEMVEDFEASQTPLLVFSCHKFVVDLIGRRPGWGLITGDTSATERTRIEDEFQSGKLIGVAGTMQAMGLSITLTRASDILIVDRWWNPSVNEQAEDRANRIGQTSGVVVRVLLAAKTIDERVEEIIDEKAKIIAGSVDKSTAVRQEIAGLAGVRE